MLAFALPRRDRNAKLFRTSFASAMASIRVCYGEHSSLLIVGSSIALGRGDGSVHERVGRFRELLPFLCFCRPVFHFFLGKRSPLTACLPMLQIGLLNSLSPQSFPQSNLLLMKLTRS
jgi:hypothetical protein